MGTLQEDTIKSEETFHNVESKSGSVEQEEKHKRHKYAHAMKHLKPFRGRFERLWLSEVQKVGMEKASVLKVLWRFVRTRVLVSAMVQLATLTLGFIAPTFLVKSILEYSADSTDKRLWYGLILASMFCITEFAKVMCFVTQWALNYQTAMRVRSGVLCFLYMKMLKLRCLKDKTIGQMVNMFTNDGQRLVEAVNIGPLVIGGPIIAVATSVYCCLILSPWALVGTSVFILFYPYQFFISRLTAYLRRKGVVVTDKRIRMMNEILTSIKLIKLYAWEKAFAQKIAGVRGEERRLLEKSAYVNTLSIAFTPMVPVFAAILTFVAHTLAGHDLTAPQAFTIISAYNLMRMVIAIVPSIIAIGSEALVGLERMQTFSILACYLMLKSRLLEPLSGIVKSLTETDISAARFKAFSILACFQMMRNRVLGPLSGTIKALSEVQIGADRFKSVLAMEERQPIEISVSDSTNAVEIVNGSFAWDVPKQQNGNDKSKELKNGKIPSGGSKESEKIKKISKKSEKSEVLSKKSEKNKSISNSDVKQQNDFQVETEPLKSGIKEDLEYIEVLHNINLTIPKGELYGVCGAVGSGKSSLISALLNQMIKVKGNIGVNGTVAYVPQQAWIMNDTLHENVIFGEDFDEEKYTTVLQNCNLIPDLDMLPGGDLTEIGERGINLSGGQKQRVSLARAVYSDRDIYVLDDPLSAVDPHVGQHLFEYCIKGALKGKSVLFVTHQLQYLNQCDYILHMKDGYIHEEGTHTKLMDKDGEYANLIKTFHTEHDSEKTAKNNPLDNPSGLSRIQTAEILRRKSSTAQGKLMKEEEIEKGTVSVGAYKTYFKAAGGVGISTIVLLSFSLPVGCAAFSNWWLSYWISQGSGNTSIVINNETVISDKVSDNPDLYFYEIIYSLTILGVVVTMCLRGFLFMKTTLRASTRLHDGVFARVLRSSMAFFDTTPVGRTLNRFSKDLDDIDTKLPLKGEVFLQNAFLVLTSVTVIAVIFPWFLLVLIPVAAVFLFLFKIFRVALREVKRADNVARSPWISLIATTIQGLHTINAYNKNQDFLAKFCTVQDRSSMLCFLFYYFMRWLTVRLDFLTILVTTCTALFIVITKGTVPTAYAGLALAYSAQMTGLLQFTIRLACEVEATFTSVERIQYFIDHIECESDPVIESSRPPKSWPDKGAITYTKYAMRYRPGLPLVLKGIDCDIQSQEKIGIVGRTGSGKSSLGVALFRLVEPNGGSIKIDNIDVTKIGLDDLRSKLSIIPQDPVLFIGTVRYNLDPFDHHSDDALWEALEKCHIKEVINNLDGRLEAPVVENGENFSVGERQLICMARALLRHSKILMLDEATAAIDTETDAKIQTTIKEAFSDCTMLTVAHRLNTVLSCDKILVLENGKVVEFDTPSKLLSDVKSKFYSMVSASDVSNLHKDNAT